MSSARPQPSITAELACEYGVTDLPVTVVDQYPELA